MTTLTARGPVDLLAMVRVVLGFEPADSLVMLTVDSGRPFHARVDLPPEAGDVGEVVDLLLDPAVRHRVRAAVLVVYTADDSLARAAVRRLTRGLRGCGPEVVEALRVHEGRWFPLMRERPPGEGGRGTPFDVSGHPFLVEAVLSGRVLHGSREELAATLRPDPPAVAAVAAAGAGPPVDAAWVLALLRHRVAGEEQPTSDEVARLLAALGDDSLRAVVCGALDRRSARDHVRLWEDVVRRSPEPSLGLSASVLALAAWVAGDGALAWCAVDRAREAGPGHPLADLVADLLTGAVPPDDWEVVRTAVAS